jgi:hypothetical protein
MTSRAARDLTDEEILGVEACRVADAIAAAAPPFTPQQRDDLAVLLRRSRRSDDETANDAA